MARFVEARAGVRPSAAVVTALHRQTGGNPFFLDEVVRLLVAEGRLTQQRGATADGWACRSASTTRSTAASAPLSRRLPCRCSTSHP